MTLSNGKFDMRLMRFATKVPLSKNSRRIRRILVAGGVFLHDGFDIPVFHLGHFRERSLPCVSISAAKGCA
jgi:hypothetical protein